jgi:hypothetical protein
LLFTMMRFSPHGLAGIAARFTKPNAAKGHGATP